MRSWNLTKSDPIQLTLAADFRFTKPDYINDQIWEVKMGSGDPPAFALQTTFGLRARSMRIFPRFIRKDSIICNPVDFYSPPALVSFYPNYIAFKFYPFAEITALLELWANASNCISGRVRLNNASILKQNFTVEWICQLNPLGDGENMSIVQGGAGCALQGSTEDLRPVFSLTGGPVPGTGPFPSLNLDYELLPGKFRQVTWALGCLAEPQAALELTRTTTARRWDAEISRLELQNTSQTLEIHTGNPDWDAALALAQKSAFGLIFPSSQHLPNPSFVLARQPDKGYSIRGNGSDYSHLWNGQTPLDTYYLTSLIPGAEIDLVKGFLENFISIQDESGFIDHKPGLAGQRSRHLAQPILATFACQVHKRHPDSAWLAKLYPALVKYLKLWFSVERDGDQDGFPSWQHPIQTGLEEAPIYHNATQNGQRVELQALESPALAAFLFKECESLESIAGEIHEKKDAGWLNEKKDKIRQSLNETWDAASKSFHYRDCVTHQSTTSQRLLTFKGSGSWEVKRQPKVPSRVVIILNSIHQATRAGKLMIIGRSETGACVEEILFNQWIWVENRTSITSRNIYITVDRIDIQGMPREDNGIVETVDYRKDDLSLFLPLWAGVPSREQAADMVDALVTRYLMPGGFAISPLEGEGATQANGCVLFPWNQLIGEGLLHYGFRDQAADLVTRLMETAITSLKATQGFGEYYDARVSQPLGERNHLRGFTPVDLFLKTLGVWHLSPNRVILVENNPFPDAVTLKYRGMTITRHAKDTLITFPAGQTITVEGGGPHLITLPPC